MFIVVETGKLKKKNKAKKNNLHLSQKELYDNIFPPTIREAPISPSRL